MFKINRVFIGRRYKHIITHAISWFVPSRTRGKRKGGVIVVQKLLEQFYHVIQYRYLVLKLSVLLCVVISDETPSQCEVDNAVLMLTVAVFITSCSTSVICTPSLVQPSTAVFKNAWKSHNIPVCINSNERPM